MNKTNIMKLKTNSKNVVTVVGKPPFHIMGSTIKEKGGKKNILNIEYKKARVVFFH